MGILIPMSLKTVLMLKYIPVTSFMLGSQNDDPFISALNHNQSLELPKLMVPILALRLFSWALNHLAGGQIFK